MKKSIIISAIMMLGAFAIQAQPKYTKVASNQSAYKVKNLDGYKETGSKAEDRNQFQNAQSYKNAPAVKPEAKGEGFFPVLPEGVTENNSLASKDNYKSQFKSAKVKSKTSGQTLPVEEHSEQDYIISKEDQEK